LIEVVELTLSDEKLEISDIDCSVVAIAIASRLLVMSQSLFLEYIHLDGNGSIKLVLIAKELER
jgi:hypothetical protein